MFRTWIIIGIFVSALTSCTGKKQSVVDRGFYYWQTEFHLSEGEKNTLSSLHVTKLFVKFFDVDWDNATAQPVPQASLICNENIPPSFSVVPVIYIANRVFENISADDIQVLAFKCNKKIQDILEQNKFLSPAEIQIDCDWTVGTKEKYFRFLEEMKKFPAWKNITWSATIRLHQVKYPDKTGIPPVNRGTLMFYNMGDIQKKDTVNSIFDSGNAEKYIASVKNYPLPLDAGIALFSWGLLFDDHELLKIIYPLHPSDMTMDTLFSETQHDVFTAQYDGYYRGSFVDKGDEIRIEEMDPARSLSSAQMLAGEMKNDSICVILYHLDSTILKLFSNEDIEAVYNAFH